MKTNESLTIACVGMTHLGLIHAAAFAEKGFNLICYDEQVELIQKLQKQETSINEPGLNALLTNHSSHMHFTHDINQLKQCSLVFIAYDVPTDDVGTSDLTVINNLIKQVSPVLSPSACLILLSQVPPGYTRQINFAKERLFYQVETLVFGQAIHRASYPERYIVGSHDPKDDLPEAYDKLLASFGCPILNMRYESAELAKISINMFLVSSVTTTNTIAEICENIGADWNEIAPALRLDKRIGQHAYLAPGLGLSGGNLERDLNTILKLGATHHTDVDMVSAWIKNSRYRRDWVLRCLQTHVLTQIKNPVICVLGLAYKPDTHSIKNSPSIALINALSSYTVKAHDPVVRGYNAAHVSQFNSIMEAIEGADVVIIMTAWNEYKQLSLEQIKQTMRGSIVIDPYRLLDKQTNSAPTDLNYFSLGQQALQAQQKELNYV